MKKLALLSTFLGLLALVFLPTLLKNHGIYLFTYWLIYVIAAMGLNLTVGYAGQKSLGHAALKYFEGELTAEITKRRRIF